MHGCEGSPELKNKADALIAKVARTTSRSRVSRSRLAKFSHAQLLEIAVEACEGSRELKNKADALIAQVAPLPAWCVDISCCRQTCCRSSSARLGSPSTQLRACAPPGCVPTASSCRGAATSTRGLHGSWKMCPTVRMASACYRVACWRSARAGLMGGVG